MWPVTIFLMIVVAFYWAMFCVTVVAFLKAISHLCFGNFTGPPPALGGYPVRLSTSENNSRARCRAVRGQHARGVVSFLCAPRTGGGV